MPSSKWLLPLIEESVASISTVEGLATASNPPAQESAELGSLIGLLFKLTILLLGLLGVAGSLMLFALGWSLAKAWGRGELLKASSLPLFFVFGFILALILTWDAIAMANDWIISVVILFLFGWLLTAAWGLAGRLWWIVSLGRASTAQVLTDHALKRYRESIRVWESDYGFQRPIADVAAVLARLRGFPELQRDLRRIKPGKEKQMLKTLISDLNSGWREGLPPEILNRYIKDIKRTAARKTRDKKLRLRGLCAVTNVQYLLGNLDQAYALAVENWREAGDDLRLQWMASYAYFGSMSLFLGEFEETMEGLLSLWKKHYSQPQEVRKSLEKEMNTQAEQCALTVNPVVAVPRHLFLCAGLNGSPIPAALEGPEMDQRQYWPQGRFGQLSLKSRQSEREWMNCWYEEAKEICGRYEDQISLDFTHAYAAFYMTLLHLDGNDSNNDGTSLADRAGTILKKEIKAKEIVTQYAKEGFCGVYKLAVMSKSREALEHLRKATAYSAISGNRFAMIDLLFMCCHAIAAARESNSGGDPQHLKPEVDYYLRETRKLARRIGHAFYFGLEEAARAEVSKARGERVLSEGYKATSEWMVGKDRKRVLLIFGKESSLAEPPSSLGTGTFLRR